MAAELPEGYLNSQFYPLEKYGSKLLAGILSIEHESLKSMQITSNGKKHQDCSLPETDGWRRNEPRQRPTHTFSFAATYPGIRQRWGQSRPEMLEERDWEWKL